MQLRSSACGTIALLASLVASPTIRAAEVVPTVTFVEGKSTIVTGNLGYQPAAGVRLNSCDMLRTGSPALVLVELDDGAQVVLGPDSRMLFGLPHAGEPVVGPQFLLSGWAKVTVPKRDKAPPHRIGMPHFDLMIDAGVVLLRVTADDTKAFVEQGAAAALVSAGSSAAPVAVAGGRMFSRKSGQAAGELTNRADPAFVSGMPRAFRDTLPALLAQLKVRDVLPKPAPEFSAAEAEEARQGAPALRACLELTVRQVQEALERNGLNVGLIDGVLGPRTQAALREFQQQRGLGRSGQLDAATLKALEVSGRR